MLDLPAVRTDLDGTIRQAIDAKTKPPGSLGAVETLAARIARIQGSLTPRLRRCRLTLFAADHGVASEGVSAYPQAVTRQMVANFLAGGAAASVFARTNDVELEVVDAGVAGDPPLDAPGLVSRRIAPGTRNLAVDAAMTEGQFDAALRAGLDLGTASGAAADAAAFGEMGIANTSSATLIAHKLTGVPLDALTGRGTGLDDDGLVRKRRVLARAADRTADRLAPDETLREYGGFEIVMMAGAMIGAARTGAVVIVDGFIASAAALAADGLAPALRDYLVFAHRSTEPGHDAVLDAFGASPLLDLGLRLGEGTGALLAWPILRSAAAMLSDMASFESAGVSGPSK